MTVDEWIAKQQAKIDEIVKFNKPLMIAVRGVMAMQSKRIFIDGKNISGSNIGTYKNSPLYVSGTITKKTNLPKFPLAGKYGETNFKNGNPHKSGYFEDFLHFKKAIGRNRRIGTVDLFLTGELHRHWANSNTVGKVEARKLSPNHYFIAISDKDVKKVERYGRVFNLNSNEKALFLKSLKNEFIKALK